MRRFFTFLMLTGTLSFFLLSALDIFYTYGLTHGPLFKIPSGRHYSYLVIGDSRASGILEERLDSLTGARTLNITNYGAHLDDVLEILEYFFDKGNSVETVLLSMDQRTGTKQGVVKDWMYYPYKLRRGNIWEPRVPFMFYASRNSKLQFGKVAKKFFSDVDSSRTDDRDLTIQQSYARHQEIPDYAKQPFRITTIDSMRNLLREHGCSDLRLFISPLTENFLSAQSDSSGYKKLMRDRGYVLYDHSRMFPDTSYFADDMHIRRKYYHTFTDVIARDLSADDRLPR